MPQFEKSSYILYLSLNFQQEYEPDSSFDIALQWFVATATLIDDMVISWARKAQQNGLSFMPVPDDPFALPIRPNSEPFVDPIFIQMDTTCLKPLVKNRSAVAHIKEIGKTVIGM